MDPYHSDDAEAEDAVRRAYPFMVWPADEGGYAILEERSGNRVVGPFPTLDEAYAEAERLNAARRARAPQ